MTKLLDLDSILPPKKSIKFGGQEYPIVEMTVGLFVSIKQMEGKDLQNMSTVEQVTAYADLVRKVIPSVPDAVLEKLTPSTCGRGCPQSASRSRRPGRWRWCEGVHGGFATQDWKTSRYR